MLYIFKGCGRRHDGNGIKSGHKLCKVGSITDGNFDSVTF